MQFAIGGSCSEFPNNCVRRQFTIFKDVGVGVGHDAARLGPRAGRHKTFDGPVLFDVFAQFIGCLHERHAASQNRRINGFALLRGLESFQPKNRIGLLAGFAVCLFSLWGHNLFASCMYGFVCQSCHNFSNRVSLQLTLAITSSVS